MKIAELYACKPALASTTGYYTLLYTGDDTHNTAILGFRIFDGFYSVQLRSRHVMLDHLRRLESCKDAACSHIIIQAAFNLPRQRIRMSCGTNREDPEPRVHGNTSE